MPCLYEKHKAWLTRPEGKIFPFDPVNHNQCSNPAIGGKKGEVQVDYEFVAACYWARERDREYSQSEVGQLARKASAQGILPILPDGWKIAEIRSWCTTSSWATEPEEGSWVVVPVGFPDRVEVVCHKEHATLQEVIDGRPMMLTIKTGPNAPYWSDKSTEMAVFAFLMQRDAWVLEPEEE